MTAAAMAVIALGLLALPPRSRAAARVDGLRSPGTAGRPLRPPRRWGPRPAGGDSTTLCLAASWDLLASCLRAGLPVAEALRAITDGLPAAEAGAVRRTGDLIALGADPDDAWRPALDCPSTSALARAARRSARSGTALAGAAEDLARSARGALDEVAETRAQRAGVLITAPLGLCFLPGFICLGIVPVVIGLAGQLTAVR